MKSKRFFFTTQPQSYNSGKFQTTPSPPKPHPHTDQRLPGEDVGIETEPALGHVQPAMDQNVSLKCTRIVYQDIEVGMQAKQTNKQRPATTNK